MYRRIFVKADTTVVEGVPGRIHAVASTERADRIGDVIRQAGWDLTQFNRHPVLLLNHDYRDIHAQIGEWEKMEVVGGSLEGVARYYVGEGNPKADWAYNLASKGKAAFSVGFRADMKKATLLENEDENDWQQHYEFNGQELLEVSHVTIPANPDALQILRSVAFEAALAHAIRHTWQRPPIPSTIQEAIARW